MAKESPTQAEISLRSATSADAIFAGRILVDSFPKKATFIFGLGDAQRAKRALTKLFPIPDHRLSFSGAKLAIHNGRPVGVVLAFPGRDLGKLNRRFYRLLLGQYGLRGKIALIQRAFPLVFIKETAHDEFFLSNIVVKKGMRGRGYGSQMLEAVEDQARLAGYKKVSLSMSIDNRDAKRFFENHHYQIKAIDLESNRRVRFLGPGYQRMVKVLDHAAS